MVTLLWRGRDRSLTRQRMRGLDRADPATGLATQAVVREQLRRMTARAQRQEHAYAVLLIDLVNLAELRHKFGAGPGRNCRCVWPTACWPTCARSTPSAA